MYIYIYILYIFFLRLAEGYILLVCIKNHLEFLCISITESESKWPYKEGVL